MLPDSNHTPSSATKRVRDEPITHAIALNFCPPEFLVGLWQSPERWVAMPENSVYKDGNFGFGEHKVGAAEHRIVTSPPGNFSVFQNRDQP
jgi:hypothetical protein